MATAASKPATSRKKKVIECELGLPEPKTRVIRYNGEPKDGEAEYVKGTLPVDAIYIQKSGLAEIGNPDRIKVTIEAA